MRQVLVTIVAIAGCGRVAYDPVTDADATDGGDPDARVDADPLAPLHEWPLAGDYHDLRGGPDLVPVGGTVDASGHHFGPNQGLAVAGAMPAAVYTVDLRVAFASYLPGAWHKVLDFKDLATDEGYYTYGDRSQFVVVAGSQFADGPSQLVAGTVYRFTITRDATGVVTGAVDGAVAWQFTDSADVAVLAAGAPARFVIDDNATGMGEAEAGTVQRIRIWDRALAASELPP